MSAFPIIQKAPYKSPCNRCGECCRHGPCDLAIDYLGCEEGRQCPALEIESDGQYSCGLYKRPGHHLNRTFSEADLLSFRLLVAMFLGIGTYCQMQDNPDDAAGWIACSIPEWA